MRKKNYASLKYSGISVRLADLWKCFFRQVAFWRKKHDSGAHAAGIDESLSGLSGGAETPGACRASL